MFSFSSRLPDMPGRLRHHDQVRAVNQRLLDALLGGALVERATVPRNSLSWTTNGGRKTIVGIISLVADKLRKGQRMTC